MYRVVKAYLQKLKGLIGPRPGQPLAGRFGRNRSSGYGLFDRALGATYLHGLAEAVAKNAK